MIDPLTLTREPPDTLRAPEFDGEPMVQSFVFPLPRGRTGRAWITTAEALTVPGFGRAWVAGRLDGLSRQALAAGVRLHAEAPPALPLAA